MGETYSGWRKDNVPAGTVAYMGGVMSLPEPFTWSWGQMVQYNTERLPAFIHYDRARSSFHSHARNSLAQRFMGEWLLMLDTDHEFEPDLTARMWDRLDRHNLDVLTGVYQYKEPPYQPKLYAWNHDEGGPKLVSLCGWSDESPIFEVDAAGGGCLMVRRRVFDRIAKELKEQPFDILPRLGEDISFFDRLRRLGIKAHVDTRITSEHLAYRSITMADMDESAVMGVQTRDAEGVDVGV